MRIFIAVAVALFASGCGGSTHAPHRAVTDCGTVVERGPVGSSVAVHDAGCFVEAVHACRAARLRVTQMGVDSGVSTLFTVRTGTGHSCSTWVVTTSYVLTKNTTHRQVCRDVSIGSDGLVVAGCRRA